MRKNFHYALIGLYILTVFLLALQPVRALLSPEFKGLAPYRGNDESHYIVRIQEGLLHPFGNTSNGIFDGPIGAQPAGLELIAGFLLGWTQVGAPFIALIISVLLAPLTIVFTALILRRLGLTEKHSLLIACLYFFLLLGPLRRVVHQSWSLPITIAAVWSMLKWWQEPSKRTALVAGILVGLLMHIYLWSWTFVWTMCALLQIFTFIHDGPRQWWKKYASIVLFATTTILVALPALLRTMAISHHPLFRTVAERSSVVFSHELESPTRSLLWIILAIVTICAYTKRRFPHIVLPALSAVIALTIVLHQQLVHNTVISYWTHYYPYVCFVSIVVISTALLEKKWSLWHWASVGMASVFLIAAFIDYKGRLTIFMPVSSSAFEFQHLTPAIQQLTDGTTDTILTDRDSALIVAANTDDDVIFTEHIRHVFVPTTEYATRYCLSEAFSTEPIYTDWIPNVLHELSRAGRARDAELFKENQRTTQEACEWVQSHLDEALTKYHVTKILWNETHRPTWRIPESFVQINRGDGWSLWQR